MKIVYLLSYFELVGGQEFFLARQQAKQGHEVTIIAADVPYPIPGLQKRYEQDHIPEKLFSHAPGIYHYEGLTIRRVHCFFHYQDFILVNDIQRLLRELRPDVVFGHEPRTMVPIWGAVHKQRHGYVYILDSHDFFHTVQNHRWWQTALRYVEYFWWRRWFVDYAYRKADAIISVADECRTFMMRKHHIAPERIIDLPLGLETDYFHQRPDARARIRAERSIPDSSIVLLFAGYMFRRKALERLIESLNQVRDIPLVLVFAGDGPKEYVDELRRLATTLHVEDRVIFAGVGGRDQMIDWFSAADIGVWPGNNSLVILEAMACRLPIIMADMQLSHLVSAGNGIAIPYGDQQALVSAITRLATDPNLRSTMGSIAERVVQEKYSYAAAAKKVTDLMTRLLSEQKRKEVR